MKWLWDAFCDWGNLPIYKGVRRLDVLGAIFAVLCVSWYGYTDGWPGALFGGLMYIFMVMLAIWVF